MQNHTQKMISKMIALILMVENMLHLFDILQFSEQKILII